MKTVCVILNYNDAETAARLAGRICNYKSLDHIILVDNGESPDNGASRRLKWGLRRRQ